MGFHYFLKSPKLGFIFWKSKKWKKNTLGIHAKKEHTKFGWNPSTRKYFKIGEKKAWEQEEEEEKESIPGSIFGHFLSLIKTELFGILTSGFLHRVLLPRINRLSKKKIHKMLGNIAKIGRKNRPFSCRISSSFAAESPPEGGLGRWSLPRSLDN